MEKAAAIQLIKDACREIVKQTMKIHPAVPHLQHEETQAAVLKAMYQLTVELETVKKLTGRLEREDASTIL
jgi:hypothetical protein